MKHRTIVLLVVILLAGVAALAAQTVVEEIVAVVNDDVITLSQYRERYDLMIRTLQSQLKGDELDKQVEFVKKNLLDTMVSELLLLQMAKDKQLDVREQLKVYVDNVKKQNNIESDEDLKLALLREGLNYDTWIKQTQEDILRQMIIYNEVDSHIVIDDNATMAYFKAHAAQFVLPVEYTLRAIVLPIEAGNDAALEDKKAEISSKLAGGAAFTALAGEYDQEGLKESQGDLGTVKSTELEPTLAQIAEKLKAGEVSSWFKARNAWYLLKVEARKESHKQTFAEVKKDVESILYQEKKAKALEAFFTKIKASNYIKILRPEPLG